MPENAGSIGKSRARKGVGGETPGNVERFVRCVPKNYANHRYSLVISMKGAPGPRLAVVLKNASTASEERSDPTIGKVEAWARREGFASVEVVNLFARRTPYPKELAKHPYRRMVGPENDRYILAAAKGADLLIAAWGNPNGIDPGLYDRRVGEVLLVLRHFRIHIVGKLTQAGYPRHGLMWNGGVKAAPFKFAGPS